MKTVKTFSKNTRSQNNLKILIVLFSKMVLNFANLLKSRKIAIINKNKVISLVNWF